MKNLLYELLQDKKYMLPKEESSYWYTHRLDTTGRHIIIKTTIYKQDNYYEGYAFRFKRSLDLMDFKDDKIDIVQILDNEQPKDITEDSIPYRQDIIDFLKYTMEKDKESKLEEEIKKHEEVISKIKMEFISFEYALNFYGNQ